MIECHQFGCHFTVPKRDMYCKCLSSVELVDEKKKLYMKAKNECSGKMLNFSIVFFSC